MNRFLILSKLPTLNEYINVERLNRFAAASLKKKYTGICSESALTMPKLEDTLFDVQVNWFVLDNRSDADNVFFAIKFILDGAVESGRLKKDGRKNIRHIHHNIYTDKTYKVEVIFNKVED